MKKILTLCRTILVVIGGLLIVYMLIGLIIGAQFWDVVPDDDGEHEQQIAEECITQRIEKGYTHDFVYKYCTEISRYCRARIYEENCNPEVKCCFTTIEEDKKWNYLDYDESGNKIAK